MKNIVLGLSIALTAFVCNASNHVKACNTIKDIKENQIPKDVQKWLKKELSNTSTKVLKNFDTPAFFTKKNAKIIGYIKGYDKTQGAKTGMFLLHQPINK